MIALVASATSAIGDVLSADAMYQSAMRFAIVLAFAAVGEWVAERAGTLNISIEAMMIGGAYTAAVSWSAIDNVPIALALIFLLLYMSFGSIRQSVLVFCNVPFAAIGGVLGLKLSGEFLSVPASVGFIALIGIAVLNGVVLISYINKLID